MKSALSRVLGLLLLLFYQKCWVFKLSTKSHDLTIPKPDTKSFGHSQCCVFGYTVFNGSVFLLFPKISEKLFVDDVTPTCERCNSLVKPDIVFFGESLPKKFSDSVQADFKNCDLLIVLGTSLTVQPFASLVDR